MYGVYEKQRNIMAEARKAIELPDWKKRVLRKNNNNNKTDLPQKPYRRELPDWNK